MSHAFDAAQVWKDIEDQLSPEIALDAWERSLYYHLVCHSRLEGRTFVRVSSRSMEKAIGASTLTARVRLRTLAQKGCVRILEKGCKGTIVEVSLPTELTLPSSKAASLPPVVDPGDGRYYRQPDLRKALRAREKGRCFYCLRHLKLNTMVLDHVIPLAAGGSNTFDNLVASCFACNSKKKDFPAAEFLRSLYRRGCLSVEELDAKLAVLAAQQGRAP